MIDEEENQGVKDNNRKRTVVRFAKSELDLKKRHSDFKILYWFNKIN